MPRRVLTATGIYWKGFTRRVTNSDDCFKNITPAAQKRWTKTHKIVIIIGPIWNLVLAFVNILLLFSHPVMSDSLQPYELQHSRHPCPLPSPTACSNSCPLSLWCRPTILPSVVPFSSCLQPFPAFPGSFPMSQFFTSSGQSIGVSASALVLPMNVQDWFPLGLTGFISLLSNGLSRVSSTPQFKSINSLALSLLYSPTLTSIHDYWKNHSFDYMNLCRQSNVSAF